ncbi:lactonase 6-phosphogluconolactonase [Fadolivirus algeromassiliense]|jgi:hypothetical protein|uniref:Lactonase 6-phosphogluconolactonase n=1 Tax=Fadolivirus FV1/VV64 TaxID=3070911 RepID=A0A7D3QWN6_9VIRU|nr:lactonase 6-phosphogluconolactonase [Fadolivirus algeromassiliense]QKF94726.1 lactonase 6-phosphogluconolactonase [Fadolivirus FV1/VV64]
MFSIKLEDLNRSNKKELFIGDVKRLATATSVSFINKTYLCVAHLVGMKMYLYKFDYDKKEYNLISTINTTYNNKMTITDLMDSNKKDLIVLSNFSLGTQTIYKINNNKLYHLKDVMNCFDYEQYCHGVKFHPTNHYIIALTGNKVFNVTFYDYSVNKILHQIKYIDTYAPKDIAFIDENNILVLYTTSQVLKTPVDIKYRSRIVHFTIDLKNKRTKTNCTIDIPDSHGDSIIVHRSVIFINNQIKDEVLVFHMNNNKITKIATLQGYDKPHGLDYEPTQNLLAVSNYGDNTIKLTPLSENITSKFSK